MRKDDIWIPDLVPYGMPEGMKFNYLPWEDVRAVVFKDGSVYYVPPVTIKTWCDVNYENVPFGEQVYN